MNILHVVHLNDNKANGINEVIPKYVNSQSKYAQIAIYDYGNTKLEIDEAVTKLDAKKYLKCDIAQFPTPFNKPDLVIFHNVFCDLRYIQVAKKLYDKGIPYVVVPHGSFSKVALEQKKLKKTIALHTIFHKFIERAAAVQYLCERERENSAILQTSIIGGNGVSVGQLDEEPVIHRENLHLTFIGRKDIVHKGIDYLLEGCAIAKETLIKNKVRLSIYGPDRNGSNKKIDEMIQLYGLEEVVENNEGVFGEEKIKVLRNSDVFVLTSRFEGQPLAILEALAQGVPVLVTPETGFAEEVSQHACGWQAELSGESIGRMLIQIVTSSEEELQRYARNAYQYVKEIYDWDQVAKRTITTYTQMLRDMDYEASAN